MNDPDVTGHPRRVPVDVEASAADRLRAAFTATA